MSLVRSGGEGQKVAVRGLSPKYNVIMVNGVRMQSTDRDDRSVDLNMIAPNILSGIEVTKALTADMDADAVGGTVNLKIGKAAQGLKGNFTAQGGYGSQANTYGNYKVNGFLSNRFFNEKLGVQVSGYLENYNRNSDELNAGYAINREDESIWEDDFVPVDLQSVTITDNTTDRNRVGGSLVFDYEFEKGSIILNNFVSTLSQQQIIQQNKLNVAGSEFNAYTKDNEDKNTIISNALQGEFDFSLFSMDFSVSNSISNQNANNLSMNVGIAQNASGVSTPGMDEPTEAAAADFLAAAQVVDGEWDKRAVRFQTLHRDVKDQAQEATLNFNVPFNLSKVFSGKVKFGGKYVRNARDNDETQNFTDPDRNIPGEEFVALVRDSLWTDLGLEAKDMSYGPRASFFEDANFDIGDNFLNGEGGVDDFFFKGDVSQMHHYTELAQDAGYYLVDLKESNQYDFDYTRNLYALYASAEVNVGKYVTLFPGIRYENFNFDYNANFTEKYGPKDEHFTIEPLHDDGNKGENWFPQLHIRVKPADWLDIRMASTKSIIYPDYRSVSPFIYYNSDGDPTLSLGNTELKPALAQNYDLYASVFQNKLGLFTVGAFYKEIDNLIVTSSFYTKDPERINNRFDLTQAQDTWVSTWINLEATSTVKGIELDWQTHLWYLPSFFKGIVLNVNYTHMVSETGYPFETAVKQGTGPFALSVFVDSLRVGRMPDQPNDIFNFTIGYDIGGFSARLSYVYTDDVITSIDRTYEGLDTYTDTYKRWDFTAYQKLPWFGGGFQAFLNINNITNAPDRSFFRKNDNVASLNYYGRTVDLGLRYSFHKAN
jgi:TonB-dependent receptor